MTLSTIVSSKWPRDSSESAEPRAVTHHSRVLAVHPRENHLLTALPPFESAHWKLQLESVDMPLGYVLHEAGSTITHVHFPTSAIVSLMYVMKDGASADVAMIGNEGMVGISHLLGDEAMPNRAVVQHAGRGLRLSAQSIKDEFDRSGSVRRLLLRYVQTLITQMAQTAVCNRYHSLEQQLSRWLLCSLDRVGGSELVMTQELIAQVLGVRRESVTTTAFRMQKTGLIQYTRGRISVLDRTGLERSTCECYSVVRKEYERLLPGTGCVNDRDAPRLHSRDVSNSWHVSGNAVGRYHM